MTSSYSFISLLKFSIYSAILSTFSTWAFHVLVVLKLSDSSNTWVVCEYDFIYCFAHWQHVVFLFTSCVSCNFYWKLNTVYRTVGAEIINIYAWKWAHIFCWSFHVRGRRAFFFFSLSVHCWLQCLLVLPCACREGWLAEGLCTMFCSTLSLRSSYAPVLLRGFLSQLLSVSQQKTPAACYWVAAARMVEGGRFIVALTPARSSTDSVSLPLWSFSDLSPPPVAGDFVVWAQEISCPCPDVEYCPVFLSHSEGWSVTWV